MLTSLQSKAAAWPSEHSISPPAITGNPRISVIRTASSAHPLRSSRRKTVAAPEPTSTPGAPITARPLLIETDPPNEARLSASKLSLVSVEAPIH